MAAPAGSTCPRPGHQWIKIEEESQTFPAHLRRGHWHFPVCWALHGLSTHFSYTLMAENLLEMGLNSGSASGGVLAPGGIYALCFLLA